MSPEQALGRRVDLRSDVFSFGCVMYELATGRRAFEGATYAAVTDAVLHAEPPSLSQLRPDLPRALGRLILRCLRKDPDARFQQMAEVAAGLRGGAGRHPRFPLPRRAHGRPDRIVTDVRGDAPHPTHSPAGEHGDAVRSRVVA
jgi:serine/threonine protein kinase